MKIQRDDYRLINITKERLAVSKIEMALEDFSMVILSGPRKVGKTIAMLQIALKCGEHEYVDCKERGSDKLLEEIFFSNADVLLLIDEIQNLKDCQTWVSALYNKMHTNRKFKVVITGSVTACMEVLATQSGGGGRSGYVYMPIITYLEYLYFTNIIDSYHCNLYFVDYLNTFEKYMRLEGCEYFNIGPIDSNYIGRTAKEISIALECVRVPTNLLGSNVNDIYNAFILLTYKMAQDWLFDDTFYNPPVGRLELQMPPTVVIDRDVLENFSIFNAAKSFMSNEEIVRALRYLLWNGLVLYDHAIIDYIRNDDKNLTKLYLDKDEIYSNAFLNRLFSVDSRIAVVNPLLYSSLSDELFSLLEDRVRRNKSSTAVDNYIKQKLSSRQRNKFLGDGNVLGSWVECYLRGSLSLINPILPLKCQRFRDTIGREVDLVDDVRRVLVEVTVKKRNKTEKEVNFHYFRKHDKPCILVTRKTIDVRVMNDVPVLLIPYYVMAAFLDRGEYPSFDDVRQIIGAT